MICFNMWIVQIAAGDEHVLLLDDKGLVGIPDHVTVLQIDACANHSCVLDINGKLWIWGNGFHVSRLAINLQHQTYNMVACGVNNIIAVTGPPPTPHVILPETLTKRKRTHLFMNITKYDLIAKRNPENGTITVSYCRPRDMEWDLDEILVVDPGHDMRPLRIEGVVLYHTCEAGLFPLME